MLLRSFDLAIPGGPEWHDAWPVVQSTQKQSYETCWMITQPSHAALAGELGAALSGTTVPERDPEVLQAIALHDAGWGVPDAQAIMRSRSVAGAAPKSFLQMDTPGVLEAWRGSINLAEKTGPAGGYMVSRHFHRIALHGVKVGNFAGQDLGQAREFIQSEEQRQKKLSSKQDRGVAELESLTDLLQLCDLLSLYMCCGAQERVIFPDYFAIKLKVTAEGGNYRLDPPLIEAGTEFKVAALLHPAGKTSSREMLFRII